jgi:alanyl-tRNA synthetase
MQGYVLRRLIRRAVRYAKLSNIYEQKICSKVAQKVIEIYQKEYRNLETEKAKILSELDIEEAKFEKVIEKGLAKLKEIKEKGDRTLDGKEAFDLFTQEGFPYELTLEVAKEMKIDVDENIDTDFMDLFEKHQEVSRAGIQEKKFAGGLADKEDPQVIKYHTAAHLALAAMREILGDEVHQKGSNITAERLRFDFSWPEKLTDEQKKEIENWVNDKINRKLDVQMVEVDLPMAKEKGAEGEFTNVYGNVVKVYCIGGDIDSKDAVSKEICGGPHVENTSELGHFKITKEESSSAGVRRIKAKLE